VQKLDWIIIQLLKLGTG